MLLLGRRDAAPYNEMLRIRRTWELVFGVTARRAGVGAPYGELPRIRPNVFMWEDPAKAAIERRPHDAVPTKTLRPIPHMAWNGAQWSMFGLFQGFSFRYSVGETPTMRLKVLEK